MIVPNTNRVLVEKISEQEMSTSGIVIPGQLKAGENLFVGRVIHAGDTKFTKGQTVYYSEYSAASITDMTDVLAKKGNRSDAKTYFVVAEDDIMAYDEQTEA